MLVEQLRFLVTGLVLGLIIGSWATMAFREPWINRRYHDLEIAYNDARNEAHNKERLYEQQLLAYERKMKNMVEAHPDHEEQYEEEGWPYWKGDTRQKDRKEG